MARKRCEYGRTKSGRCRRKPARGLGSTTDNSHYIRTWDRWLRADSRMLDPCDRDDADRFRVGLWSTLKNQKTAKIRMLAKHYGAAKVPTSRKGAIEALAAAFFPCR